MTATSARAAKACLKSAQRMTELAASVDGDLTDEQKAEIDARYAPSTASAKPVNKPCC